MIYWRPKTPNTTICLRRSSPPPRPAPATHVAGRVRKHWVIIAEAGRGSHTRGEDDGQPRPAVPRVDREPLEVCVCGRSPVKTNGKRIADAKWRGGLVSLGPDV